MSDILDNLRKRDTLLLDYLEKRWCRIDMHFYGSDEDGNEDSSWEVIPERYNPAYGGEGGTLREAIESAIRRNGGEEDPS